MTYYRIYALDGTGHIKAAFDADCETDKAALDHAASAIPERSLEVWEGQRCVGKVLGTQRSSTA